MHMLPVLKFNIVNIGPLNIWKPKHPPQRMWCQATVLSVSNNLLDKWHLRHPNIIIWRSQIRQSKTSKLNCWSDSYQIVHMRGILQSITLECNEMTLTDILSFHGLFHGPLTLKIKFHNHITKFTLSWIKASNMHCVVFCWWTWMLYTRFILRIRSSFCECTILGQYLLQAHSLQ